MATRYRRAVTELLQTLQSAESQLREFLASECLLPEALSQLDGGAPEWLQRLRRSEQMLRVAGRMARLGWWMVDLATNQVEWSDEVYAIHEVPVGTTITLDDGLAFYTEPSRPVISTCYWDCVENGKPYDVEVEIQTRQGRRVWTRAIGMAERDASGRVCRVYGAFQDISEARRSAEENRRLAARLALTLESINDAFCAFDPQWRYVYVNTQAERLLRRERQALLGRVIWEEFPELRHSTFFEKLQRSLRDSEALKFEFYHEPWLAWFEVQTYPSEQGLSLYFQEVTEEKLARELARASEERFQLLARAAQDAIWDLDPVSGRMWRSEGFARLFGWSEADVRPSIGAWIERIHPDDRERVETGLKAALLGADNSYSTEYRFQREDGSFAYVLDRAYIMRAEDGMALRMVGSITDLSERRQVEERLQEQASLLDQAQDIILVKDLEHRISYWNRGAELTLGIPAQEAWGKHHGDLLGIPPKSLAAATRQVLTDGHWSGELVLRSATGEARTVQSRWTLTRDRSGQPRSILVIDTDVTEKQRMEQMALRTQRLESLGTLAGGIAHDLNNVLAPILLAVELLLPQEADAERRDLLETILCSAHRGSDMVKQVLSFARGVDGRREPVHVEALLQRVEKIVNDTFLKNVKVETRVEAPLPLVIGDLTQLHQVLLNLCVNARDAMPDGGHLHLRAFCQEIEAGQAGMHADARSGSYLCLQVSDTGTGMSGETLNKIFEPFFTTKEPGSGTGLGLSTSLAIVRSHGGFMEVHSLPGEGTTFSVYLPLPPSISKEEAPPTKAQTAPPRGNGQLIMVVDDESTIRKTTRRTLEANGYRTVLAADGLEALALYSTLREQVAVVVTDMMMPNLDGAGLIQALHELDPNVPVVASSGVGSEARFPPNVIGLLSKPYSTAGLLGALQDALSRQRPASE